MSATRGEWRAVLHQRAEQMRREPTRAEAALWQHLRRRLGGLVFWTQHIIAGRYIADFYCPAARLVIEVDGGSHEHRQRQDQQRDELMHEVGYRVLRVTNLAVLADPDSVVQRIRSIVDDPRAHDAQRRYDQARQRVQAQQVQLAAQARQRPTTPPRKARFRCTWCLADFVTALAPAPACRRCQVSEVVPVCQRCGFRRCREPGTMCARCAEAAWAARDAIGAPVEQVNRNSRHRVRKLL